MECGTLMNVDERTNNYPPAVTEYADVETGTVAPGFDMEKRRWFVLDHWVGVDEYTAIGFAVVEGATIPVGLVHYAPITRTAVQALPIGEMVKPEPWMPRWDRTEAPSPQELRNEWRRASGATKVTVTVTAHQGLRRREGQSPDEFYAEVADFYRRYASATSKPTASIAFAGNVPHSTAARWVREARRRGHLEPAPKRGK